MPIFPSRYFTSGAALRASSVGDSSGMAVMRNTCWAWPIVPNVISAQLIKALNVREGEKLSIWILLGCCRVTYGPAALGPSSP